MSATEIDIQVYEGNSLEWEIEALARFRLLFFKDFPYLYDGTEEGEQHHMQEYVSNPTATLCVAKDGENVIGVGIGTALSTKTDVLDQIGEGLKNFGLDVNRFYYFGEMILLPEYRNRGLGNRMLGMLKEAGRKRNLGRFCFLAVNRESNDLRRPFDYYDSAKVFRKFGFQKKPLYVTFSWPTIQEDGNVQTAVNRLDF